MIHWFSFGAGVLGTLTLEFLLAHYFKWSTDRELAKADAAIQSAKTTPWYQAAEKKIVGEIQAVESKVASVFHVTPVPAAPISPVANTAS